MITNVQTVYLYKGGNMFKGFINYKESKIPFVIDDYIMELFTEDFALQNFINEHRFKKDYVLQGICFQGFAKRNITILVEKTVGDRCYLTCFYIEQVGEEQKEFDTISFQSRFLDSIFRYKYNFLDFSREGYNFAMKQKQIYSIDFEMLGESHELQYKIGRNEALGLLEDFSKWGETSVNVENGDIKECYKIALVLERLMKFVIGKQDVAFNKIILLNKEIPVGYFYCKSISEELLGDYDVLFYEFDVEKYIPKILRNLAKDAGEKIQDSVPLGHISTYENLFLPSRFIEQVISFEYLFMKLQPDKAKSRNVTLQMELENMFNMFQNVLQGTKISAKEIAENIRDIRVNITHGYSYYYDFKNDNNMQYQILKLDELIKCMSLKCMGFKDKEIEEYKGRI